MSKKTKVSAATVLEVLAELEERLQSICDAVDVGVTGDSEQLRRVQRQLLFAARDSSAAASRMYTHISMAVNQEQLAELQKQGADA